MKKVFVIMHQHKPNTERLTEQLVSALHAEKILAFAEPWLVKRMGAEANALFCGDDPRGCDAVLSVGGDGTFLRANAVAIRERIPLLGVNVGTVGFLAEVEWEQLALACGRLARDDYAIAQRMMLKAELDGNVWLALNDVVLSRGGYSRLIGISASVNGEKVGSYIADGLIVSTPTGSTGYSLSAGGPIVHPEVECMLLTPVCAHSLQHRPVIASASQRIELRMDHEHIPDGQVAVDGQPVIALTGGKTLTITRADQRARFIQMQMQGFFSTIRIKLTEWTR